MPTAANSEIQSRLTALGITLPAAPKPAANYVPTVLHNGQLFVSGQLPFVDGAVQHPGKLGADVSLEDGQAAARLCAVNILAQASAALDGDLGRIVQTLKLTGFVNATPDFTQHPQVVNGASDLLAEVLGAAGTHTRAAVGMGSLPLGTSVEVDALFAVSGA